MKRFLLYGLTGTMLFAASATVSLWMQQQQVHPKTADGEKNEHASKSADKEPAGKGKHETAKADSAEELRPVVRPSGPPSPEDTVRLANSLRDRMKAVREKEEQVNARQKQLEMIYQDIRTERNVLDELRKQVGDEMKALNDRSASVERKVGELDTQRQAATKTLADIQKRQMDIDGSERKNIDKMASMYDSMAPEAAARILQQLADNGKLDTAVKLLSQMKERQAAKVLAEFGDASLAAQLLEKMRSIKRPGTTTTSAAALPNASAPAAPVSATEPR
jgi:flagellar motility protein MotE (MotC chaperone)